jgi:hypothetical protein
MAQESEFESDGVLVVVDDADTSTKTEIADSPYQQQQISVTFSLWQPPIQASNRDALSTATKEIMFDVLHDFVCEDTELVLVDDNYKNVCAHSNNASGGDVSSIGTGTEVSSISSNADETPPTNSIADFLAASNEPDSYISSDEESVFMTRTTRTSGRDGNDLTWTTWSMFYNVVYIGMTFVEQAAVMNVSSELDFMEDSVQLALDISIMEGLMDTRMEGTGFKMAMVGQELDMFEDFDMLSSVDTASTESERADDSQEFDFLKRAKILRWIGCTMILVDLAILIILTTLSKRRRKKEIEEKVLLDHDGVDNQGLCTERDVEEMLEASRQFTSKSFSRTDNGDSDNLREEINENKESNPGLESTPVDNQESGNDVNKATISTLMRSLSDILASTSFNTSPRER